MKRKKSKVKDACTLKQSVYTWHRYTETPIPEGCVSGIYVAKVADPDIFKGDDPKTEEYCYYDREGDYVDEIVDTTADHVTFIIDGEEKTMSTDEIMWAFICDIRRVFVMDNGEDHDWTTGFKTKELWLLYDMFLKNYGDDFDPEPPLKRAMRLSAAFMAHEKLYDWDLSVSYIDGHCNDVIYRLSDDHKELVKVGEEEPEKRKGKPKIVPIAGDKWQARVYIIRDEGRPQLINYSFSGKKAMKTFVGCMKDFAKRDYIRETPFGKYGATIICPEGTYFIIKVSYIGDGNSIDLETDFQEALDMVEELKKDIATE